MVTYCPFCMCQVSSEEQFCHRCGKNLGSYNPSSHHLPVGYRLRNRYLVGRVLGEGGFGITYQGLDILLERRVAIKEYFPSVFVQRESSVTLAVTCYVGEKRTLFERGREQFLQEARVIARFDNQPEIVRVLDFFPENNTAYMVMEFLEGNNLRALLRNKQRFPAKDLFEIMEPLLQAVNALHGAGILHRDISPDNIILLKSGQVKLLDFGSARNIDTEQTMTVMLKHGYAPMEQYTGYNQGPWTDVYALSATFYHCLTGRIPPSALERYSNPGMLIEPNKLGAVLTPEQEGALMKGLALEPRDRWQSIAGFYAALYGTVIKDFPWLPSEQNTEILSVRRKEEISNSKTANLKTDESGGSNGKKMRIGIIAVIVAAVVIALTAFIGFSVYNKPESRLARALDLGQKYLSEENYEQAIVEFNKAIEIDTKSVDAYLGIAEAYIRLDDLDEAFKVLEKGYDLTEEKRLSKEIDDIIQSSNEKENVTQNNALSMDEQEHAVYEEYADTDDTVKREPTVMHYYEEEYREEKYVRDYTLRFEQDEQGRITTVRLYDAYDNLIDIVKQEYDLDGNCTKTYDFTYSGNELDLIDMYQYWENGMLVKTEYSDGDSMEYENNSAGQPIRRYYYDETGECFILDEITYDVSGRMSHILKTHFVSEWSTGTYDFYYNGEDDKPSYIEIRYSEGSFSRYEYEYEYDDLQRLVCEKEKGYRDDGTLFSLSTKTYEY